MHKKYMKKHKVADPCIRLQTLSALDLGLQIRLIGRPSVHGKLPKGYSIASKQTETTSISLARTP